MLIVLVFVTTVFALPCALHGQVAMKAVSEPAVLPLEEWLRGEPVLEIPWKLEVSQPRLRHDQRFAVDFQANIPAKYFKKSGSTHELVWLIRVQGREPGWLNNEEPVETTVEPLVGAASELEIKSTALLVPGEYRAAVLLYDRSTKQRSVEFRDLRVPPLKKDPLPEASRNLPRVEFLPPGAGDEPFHLAELQGELWLPLATRQPVEIEILVNARPVLLLGALKALTEIRVSDGTLAVRAFDLSMRRVVFEQENLGRLDWPRLRQAADAINPNLVSIEQLQAAKERAEFFRGLLAERLCSPAPERAAAGAANAEGKAARRRVLIVLSGQVIFPRGTDLKPVPVPAGCDARVYLLRASVGSAWDELHGLMKPLKPRRFDFRSGLEFRKALAALLKDLGEP